MSVQLGWSLEANVTGDADVALSTWKYYKQRSVRDNRQMNNTLREISVPGVTALEVRLTLNNLLFLGCLPGPRYRGLTTCSLDWNSE